MFSTPLKQGFTLVELIVVVALLSIMATIAVPNFTQFLRNNQVQAQTDEFALFLQYARSEAVANRRPYSIDFTTSSALIKDASGTSVNSLQIDPAKIRFQHSAAAITFRPSGSINLTTTASFVFCDINSDFKNGYFVTVVPSGAIARSARGYKDINGATAMTQCQP